MNKVTIPKKRAAQDDVVIIPRREYEELIAFRKIREFTPTAAEKRALVHAENNFKKKKTLSYNDLITTLGAAD